MPTVYLRKRREGGAALIIAMMVLAIMGVIGLSALETVALDQQAAGYQSRKRVAFYAAEAGVAEALATLSSSGTPVIRVTTLGDTALFPHGQPGYQLAPGTTIEKLGSSAASGMSLNISQGGAATFQVDFWKFEVEGQEQSGTISRIEVAAGRLTGN